MTARRLALSLALLLLVTPLFATFTDGSGEGAVEIPDDEEDNGPSAFERAVERFLAAFDEAADNVAEAVRSLDPAYIPEAEVTALIDEVAGAQSTLGAGRSRMEQIEAELREAEAIATEDLERALRAGVLMSEVELIGDPVHPSTGALHHLEREFHVTVGDTTFDFSRLHRGDLSLGRLFGRGWFAPMESFAFFAGPRALTTTTAELEALRHQLRLLGEELLHLAAARYGEATGGGVESYLSSKEALIDRAGERVETALHSSERAVSLAPSGYSSSSEPDRADAVELVDRCHTLGTEVERLRDLYSLDATTGEALLSTARRIDTLLVSMDAALRKHARLVELQRLSRERSVEARRRGVPEKWLEIGAGVIGVVDERGTLLLYRSADGAFGAGPAAPLGKQREKLEITADGGLRRTTIYGERYEYDLQGRLKGHFDRNGIGYRLRWEEGRVTVTCSYGRTVRITVDEAGRAVEARTPGGDSFEFDYESDRGVRSVRRPDGGVYRYRYEEGPSARVLLSEIEKPGGATVSFRYDREGRVVELTDEIGAQQRFGYDPERRMMWMIDRRGGEHRYRFCERGLPILRIGPEGGRWSYRYDDQGRLIEMIDPAGRREHYRFGEGGRLEERVTATGARIAYSYDREGRITAQSDGPRGPAAVQYDELGNVVGLEDHEGRRTILRDGLGRPSHLLDELGGRRSFRYDPLGYPAEVRYEGGAGRTFETDPMGRMVRVEDEEGAEHRYTYDPMGRLTEIGYPDGGIERREYGKRGELLAVTRPGGSRRVYRYDEALRLLEEELPDGRVRRYSYDGEGALLSVMVGERVVERYERDLAGRVIATYDHRFGGRQLYDLDPLGRPVRIIDPEGGTSELSYGVAMAPREVREPGGARRHFRYDRWGRLLEARNAAGAVQRYEYDRYGRVRLIRNVYGGETRLRYDRSGRLIERRDPHGGIWRFRWGLRGELLEEITPGGGSRLYSYTPAGRLSLLRSAEGRERSFRYDPAGRLLEERFGDLLTHHYSYDLAGRMVERRIGNSRWKYRYDLAGRVREIEEPDGLLVRYEYDELDRLVRRVSGEAGAPEASFLVTSLRRRDSSLTVEGARRYTLRYDRTGRVIGYEDPDGVSKSYTYDGAGRLVGIESAAGPLLQIRRGPRGFAVEARHPDGSVESWRRDAAGQLLEHHHSSGTRRSFRRDLTGRLTGSRTGDGPWTTREYDLEGRLIREGSPHSGYREFRYDRDGYLIEATHRGSSVNYSYDAAGRLIEANYGEGGTVITQEYDLLGNVTTRRYEPFGLTENRSYTAAGRLTRVELAGQEILSLSYDHLGREVHRRLGRLASVRSAYDDRGRLESVVLRPGAAARSYGVVYQYTEAGRLAGEIYSDLGAKLYTYNGAGLPTETHYALHEPDGGALGGAPSTQVAQHAALYRRLRLLDPRASGFISATTVVETPFTPYAYPDPRVQRAGDQSPAIEVDPTGQLERIRGAEEEHRFSNDPLHRLSSVSSADSQKREERTYRYPTPEALYPAVTLLRRDSAATDAPGTPHRYRVEPREGEPPEGGDDSLLGGSAEATIMISDGEFPAIYATLVSGGALPRRFSTGIELTAVLRDPRGTPIYRVGEYGEKLDKWLYKTNGECIIGDVENEGALGFAGGTATGPLPHVRLGYRFYDPASGHFTMADPSGRDLHPTLYAGGDPINSVDPWGLERYNMIGFDRASERIHVQVWDDMRPDRPISVLSYDASSRVRTPEERDNQPVRFDPDGEGPREAYHRFPKPFPPSPDEGWEIFAPYVSANPLVGPALRTNAFQTLDTYSKVPGEEDEWEKTGSVRAGLYLVHGGKGRFTEGCIKMADRDAYELQDIVRAGRASRLYTLEGGKPE